MRRFLAAGLAAFLSMQPAAAEEFRLTVATAQAPVFPYIGMLPTVVLPEIARLVEERTDHSIVWTEAYAGTLVKAGAELEAVEVGLTDMAVVLFTAHLPQLPLHTVTYFTPFATDDPHKTVKVFNDLQTTLPALGGVWADRNQVYMATIPVEAFNLYSKAPVTSVADLRGLKVGAIGPNAHWFRDLGAVGVTFNLANIYNDMQAGVFNAAVLADSVAASLNLHEVAPYRTQIEYGPMIFAGITVNADRWNALPPEVQEIFRKVFATYQTDVVDLLIDTKAKGDARMLAEGLTLVELDPAAREAWVAAMPDIAGDWARDLEARGQPAGDVVRGFMAGLRAAGATPLRAWDDF